MPSLQKLLEDEVALADFSSSSSSYNNILSLGKCYPSEITIIMLSLSLILLRSSSLIFKVQLESTMVKAAVGAMTWSAITVSSFRVEPIAFFRLPGKESVLQEDCPILHLIAELL
jgi:hypothetical protein